MYFSHFQKQGIHIHFTFTFFSLFTVLNARHPNLLMKIFFIFRMWDINNLGLGFGILTMYCKAPICTDEELSFSGIGISTIWDWDMNNV